MHRTSLHFTQARLRVWLLLGGQIITLQSKTTTTGRQGLCDTIIINVWTRH